MLRLAIDLRPRERERVPVIFTSANPGEGKSTLTANYALVAAQNERRVLLIDADLRRPMQHRLFSTSLAPGLTDIVAADVRPENVLKPIQSIPGVLHLLTAGTSLINAGDVVGSKATVSLFARASEEYDLVVVDTPPVLAASDAATIASHTGAEVALVVDKGTKRRAVRHALEKLELVGANVLGVVRNRDGSLGEYGYY